MSARPRAAGTLLGIAAAVLVTACSAGAGRHGGRGFQRHHHGGRRGERVRQRDQPDRRQIRARHRDREQPEHRPAHVRGEPERGPGRQRRRLVVQNGLGYDAFMNKIESAAPSSGRKVIDVQKLLGLPDSTPNPHLWYSPATMPAVARAIAADLSAHPARSRRLLPGHGPPLRRLAAAVGPGARRGSRRRTRALRWPSPSRSATTCCRRPGTHNLTPFGFQADIMNGVDPSPQDVTLQNSLFAEHKVKVFLYNQQVTDSLTASFLASRARRTASRWSACTRPCRAGLHLPDLDAGRGPCAPAGGGRQGVHPEARVMSSQPPARVPGRGTRRRGRERPAVGGREILHDVSFSHRPGRVHRPDRVQRGGQDHPAPGDPRAAAADRGHRAGRRPGPVTARPG